MQHCTMQVHDIEDLASEGRRLSACPYFASKEFAHDAEIVFCPYSYLVRPSTWVHSQWEATTPVHTILQ